jgi:hypothetical protein
MTPQQKAKELTNNHIKELLSAKYLLSGFVINDLAKLCALLAVDEVLNNNCGSYTDESNAMNEEIYCDEYYWHEVKQEIGKL